MFTRRQSPDKMVSLLGVMEDIEEVWRSGNELSVEWRIPQFLSLPMRNTLTPENSQSSPFAFCDTCWTMRVNRTSSEWVRLEVRRMNSGQPKYLSISVGILGPDGVEKKREFEGEFKLGDCWRLTNLCTKTELRNQKDRLLPDGALTILCEMKILDTPRDVSSDQQPSNSQITESEAPANRSQTSHKRGEIPSGVLVTYFNKELEEATRNFCDLPFRAGGCKIGEGGFGIVYRAIIRGDVVAVKKLKDTMDTQLITELMILTNYKHENLLPLLGFSLGPTSCLVYVYMPNGSLEDRLACKDETKPLSWQTRLSISYGSALGINHLHTFGEKPMVHRDIKSANILLDRDFVPKVGDFGLVRSGSSGASSANVVTENVSGTRVYMPREALLGEVSVKWDTFSFGVVLLELLTGLPPFDPNREDIDLVTHMELCEDILPRLDPKAEWKKEAAKELYKIARKKCLVESRRARSNLSEILGDLRKLSLLR